MLALGILTKHFLQKNRIQGAHKTIVMGISPIVISLATERSNKANYNNIITTCISLY